MARLLAFVAIFVESPEMDNVVRALSQIDDMVGIYEVTGEYDIVTLVTSSDIERFRSLLKDRILKIKGVKSTVTSVVLKEHPGKASLFSRD